MRRYEAWGEQTRIVQEIEIKRSKSKWERNVPDKVRPVKEGEDLKERTGWETLILVTREEEEDSGRDGKAERKVVCSVSFPQGEIDRVRESGKEE